MAVAARQHLGGRRLHEQGLRRSAALHPHGQQARPALLHELPRAIGVRAWRGRPAASTACAVPTLGCPAKASSRRGVKMRTR